MRQQVATATVGAVIRQIETRAERRDFDARQRELGEGSLVAFRRSGEAYTAWVAERNPARKADLEREYRRRSTAAVRAYQAYMAHLANDPRLDDEKRRALCAETVTFPMFPTAQAEA